MKKSFSYSLTVLGLFAFILLQAGSEVYTEDGSPVVNLSPIGYEIVIDGLDVSDDEDSKSQDKKKNTADKSMLKAEGRVQEVQTAVNGSTSVIVSGTLTDYNGNESDVTLHCDMAEGATIPKENAKVQINARIGGPLKSDPNTWLLLDAEVVD